MLRNALPYRGPPHNIEAEQALLGAILVNNEALDRVEGFLEAQHFYDPLHRKVYETIVHLSTSSKLITPITLKPYFENAEPIDAGLTVSQYLVRLAVNATTIINAREYGATIRDLATRRQLILIGEDMVNAAYDTPVDFPPGQQVDEAQQRLDALLRHSPNERPSLSFAEALAEGVDAIQVAYQRGDGLGGLSTGFREIDAIMCGMPPGNLIVIGARPGMGKTALALDIVVNVARAGTPAVIVSLEMTATDLAIRALSPEVGIPANDLRGGTIREQDMRTLIAPQQQLSPLPITIEQSGGLTMPQLAARLRKLKREKKAGFAAVDYLGLVHGTTYRGNNRVQEVGEITAALKALAKELNIPILLLCQLSREPEKRKDKRPQLSDLRDSGNIEQDADMVASPSLLQGEVRRSQHLRSEISGLAGRGRE